jgi:hypothetical protein
MTVDRIPRIIHYCWFGDRSMSEEDQRYVNEWPRKLPGSRLMKWSEDNFDVEMNEFCSGNYRAGKYAFVTDFVRAYALAKYGGIYLDTDVEIKLDLSPLLHHRAFSGFELPGFPFTALWAAEQAHPWPQAVVDHYDELRFNQTEDTNSHTMKMILEQRFGIDSSRDELQIGREGVAIYPSTAFCLDLPVNYATHHFSGSWLPEEWGTVDYKSRLNEDATLRQAVNLQDRREDLVVEILRQCTLREGADLLSRVLVRAGRQLFKSRGRD